MKVFENGTESANANESVTPLARLAKVDNEVAKGKMSKTALVDFIALENESEKSDVSATVNRWPEILESASDTVGDSASALRPWKSFPVESEMVGFSVSEYEYWNPGVETSLAELTVVSDTVSPEAPATVTWSQYSTTRNWTLLNGPIVPVT